MVKSLPLTKGKFAIIDDEDYESLCQYKWTYLPAGYAYRKKMLNNKSSVIYMHRAIVDAPQDKHVDHVNGCGIDNRRINLRVCTVSDNMANRPKKANSSSQYKGVFFHKKMNSWTAQIKREGKRRHLGYFTLELDAKNAYDNAAKELHGQFAYDIEKRIV